MRLCVKGEGLCEAVCEGQGSVRLCEEGGGAQAMCEGGGALRLCEEGGGAL